MQYCDEQPCYEHDVHGAGISVDSHNTMDIADIIFRSHCDATVFFVDRYDVCKCIPIYDRTVADRCAEYPLCQSGYL